MVSPKRYLEYLDKEMTIKGIMSVFCVSVAGLVAKTILGINPQNATTKILSDVLWTNGSDYILAGAACLLAAALCFYLQRSLLAWYYGQLCLSDSKGKNPTELLDNADSWATWIRYRWAFVFATLGFVYLGIPLLQLHGLVNYTMDSSLEEPRANIQELSWETTNAMNYMRTIRTREERRYPSDASVIHGVRMKRGKQQTVLPRHSLAKHPSVGFRPSRNSARVHE